MAVFNWYDIYSVNNEIIDNQHKHIIELFNKLYDNLNEQSHDLYYSVLADLSACSATHFASEENYMLKINYAERAKHIQAHKVFTEKLQTLKEKSITDLDESCRELIYYLGFWILNHETEEDKKMVVELSNFQSAT